MELLGTDGNRIVDESGRTVSLRGFAVGGWMNMEHFMNGFPGAEHQLRTVMATELGAERARFFFDRLLDYFLTESDVRFIRSIGGNVVRLAVNYRHFESDEAPFQYLEAGFGRLGAALDWCREHELHVILDLHAAQGWQNSDWHSDNASRHSYLWADRLYQDRFVALWEEFARRYVGDPAIAGYDLMNEPLAGAPYGRFRENMTIQLDHHYVPDWKRMNALYRRSVGAIRAIDPDHIIFLEGDYFSGLFGGLEAPFSPNLVYSNHTYNPGPAMGWGVEEQRTWHDAHEGTQFCRKHGVPLYAGEFGAPTGGPSADVAARTNVIDAQIRLYNEMGDHWTIWNYKDIGTMGSVVLGADSPYVRAIEPVLRVKNAFELDSFGLGGSSAIKAKIAELARMVEAEIRDPALEPEVNQGYLEQQILSGYVSQLAQKTFAGCFKEMDEQEIDAVLRSHRFEQCELREQSVAMLRKRFAD